MSADTLGSTPTERRELLLAALGPRALPYLEARLELERRQAAYEPGVTFDLVAYHGGRVALLEEMVSHLRQAAKD